MELNTSLLTDPFGDIKMKMTCQRCGNQWEYKGSNPYYAPCSKCKTSVVVPKNKQ